MTEMTSAQYLEISWEKEEDFQNAIIDLAELYGWKIYFVPDWIWRLVVVSMNRHPRRGRRWASAGFPDMVLCKPPRILFWETKTQKGVVRPPQKEWISALQDSGVEARVIRPKDWDYIVGVLTDGGLPENRAGESDQ